MPPLSLNLCALSVTPNQFCNAWERRGSDPQPFIDVSIKATPEDAHTLLPHCSAPPPPPPTPLWLTLAASPA